MKYNQTVDVVKGLLILLVIIGHVLLGSQRTPVRYFIYLFHMPLFLFVGGYLVNLPKLSEMSWKEIFVKYYKRMLKAWGFAWVIYTMLVNVKTLSVSVVFANMLNPYFHLWFIPSYFLMICLAVACSKKKISVWWIVLLGAFTICFQCFYNMPNICKLWPLIYFAFGILFRQHQLQEFADLLNKFNLGGGNYIAFNQCDELVLVRQ
jgi:fucose 4-O-acetylase-like acetyltransferase